MTSSEPWELTAHPFGEPGRRPGIAGTAYDTAWLASVPAPDDPQRSQFPLALQWLVDHQWPDGSWGGAVRYEHDRVLCTLAALIALARFGRREPDQAALAAGTRYLWQNGHRLAHEPTEPVGFELLLPSLVQRAQQAGIVLPPHLDIYALQRAEKLRLIPDSALYSPQVTIVHSLEFLGEQADWRRLQAAQGANGALGNSPAATAYLYAQTYDPAALRYLEACLAHTGGVMAPVLHPCETFELLWAAYHLFAAGVPARQLLSPGERRALAAALAAGGVSLSPSFPIPDADDTAVALLLLHACGDAVDPGVLRAFAQERGGCFASFPYERHASVGVNLHVLETLLRVPGYPESQPMIARLLDYLVGQQVRDSYWFDKWHISPYYATAHALLALTALAPDDRRQLQPVIGQAREWLRQTQNADGSWGFYDQPTLEETAYGLLALAAGAAHPDDLAADDRARCATAAYYLQVGLSVGLEPFDERLPALWIDKCLYTPILVVRAAIESGLLRARQLGVVSAFAFRNQHTLVAHGANWRQREES